MRKTKYFKTAGVAFATLLVVCVLLILSLYWSPVLTFVLNRVGASIVGDEETEISVGYANLDFPLSLELKDVKVDTIADVGHLMAEVDARALIAHKAIIKNGLLEDADLNISIPESEDSTSTPLGWDIMAKVFAIRNTKMALQLPNLPRITTTLPDVNVNGLELCIDDSRYSALHADMSNVAFTYDTLSIKKIRLDADSLSYSTPMQMHAQINHLSFLPTAFGVSLNEPLMLCGGIDGNLKKMRLKDFDISQPSIGHICIDGTVRNLDDIEKLVVDARVKIQVDDIQEALRSLSFIVSHLSFALPPSSFQFEAPIHYDAESGNIGATFSSVIDASRIKACFTMNLKQNNYDIDADIFGLDLERFVPQLGIGIVDGRFKVRGNGFDINHDHIYVNTDIRHLQYDGRDLRNISLEGNLTDGGLSTTIHSRSRLLDADIIFSGNMSRILSMNWDQPDFSTLDGNLKATIKRADLYGLHLTSWPLTVTSVVADATIKQGLFAGNISSRNKMLYGDLGMNGTLAQKDISMNVNVDISDLDVKAAGIADERFITALHGDFAVQTNFKQSHSISGTLHDITFEDKHVGNTLLEADLLFVTNSDTTYSSITSQSLFLNLTAEKSLNNLIDAVTDYAGELTRQISSEDIDYQLLQRLLPNISFNLNANSDNPLMPIIRQLGYDFDEINAEIHANNKDGINGTATIKRLVADSTQIDYVSLMLQEDEDGTRYYATAQNYADNPEGTFRILVNGMLLPNFVTADAQIYDGEMSLGLALAAQAIFDKEGFNIHLTNPTAILGYKEYAVNQDNFVYINKENRVTADLTLRAADGTGIQIYSADDNLTVGQDVTLSVHNFELGELTSILPFFPKVSGELDGDFHITQANGEWTLASDLGVRSMIVEGANLSDVRTEFTLMPHSTGDNLLVATLYKDEIQVADINGQYNINTDLINANIQLPGLPMEMANAFLPNDIIRLYGIATADSINITGRAKQPIINGEIYLDSAYITSEPYGVTLRFDNDPVLIQNSRLQLENFSLYGYNDNPLIAHGELDFADFDNIGISLRLKAENFQVISSKRRSSSVAYGKAFVNFLGMLNGNMSMMRFTGRADLLASSDLTYVLKDSPLNTDDRLKDLVTFTDFRDTALIATIEKPQLTNINMNLTLNVEPGAHIRCNINEDGTNYVNLEGGGELKMKYSAATNLTLSGRYTLTSGEMRYSLPVIPLKTFKIREGSYVEFNGDIMNPRLNITATQKNQAEVSNANGPHTVEFDTGLKVSQALENMKLEFIIDAPEDITVRSELAMMNAEQRNKLAIIMLSTGVYASDGNQSKFTMNNALNSFIQNEISNITGNNLGGFDISMGIDNKVDAMGSYTDYSFKFAKRFWNNRFGVTVGGVVSSANNIYGNSGIDNVTMEYRLDNTAMRTLHLFYKRDTHDIFEGNISQFGAGIVLKKQMDRFAELFQFGRWNHDKKKDLKMNIK